MHSYCSGAKRRMLATFGVCIAQGLARGDGSCVRGCRWLLLASLAVTPEVASGAALSLRELPTVVERWSYAGGGEAIALAGGRLLVAGERGVAALDAATGRVLWSREVGDGDCWHCPLAVVGDTVAYGSGATLHLLRLDNGESKRELELPGTIAGLAGPPLVAQVRGRDDSALVSIDLDRGEVAATQAMAGDVFAPVVGGGVAAVIVDVDEPEAPERVEGYDATSLGLRWTMRMDVLPSFAEREGRVYLPALEAGSECDDFAYRRLDLLSGKLAAPLPCRESTEYYDSELPWDLQLEAPRSNAALGAQPEGDEDEAGAHVLRRNDPATGGSLWRSELPGRPRATHSAAGELFVTLDAGGARSILAILDWDDGQVRQLAFGLPESTRELLLHDDLLLARADGRIVAVETQRFGPPESRSRPVPELVASILLTDSGDDSIFGRGDHIRRRLAELELIGDAACPAIGSLLVRLGPTSIAAAATFAELHRCHSLAPGLARLLTQPLEWVEEGWSEWKPPLAILHALAVLGGEAEVPPVAAILSDAARPAELRRAAVMALAAIGSQEAVAAVRRFLATPPPARSTFAPPDPLAFLELAGRPVPPATDRPPEGADAASRESFWSEMRLRRRGADAGLWSHPEGERWVVYHSGYLGGSHDLWLARVRPDGTLAAPPRLTGLMLPRSREGEALGVEVREGMLIVRGISGQQPASAEVAAVFADTDGDGLSDLEEARLHLDPGRRDSDGDGLDDSVDPAPGHAVMRRCCWRRSEISRCSSSSSASAGSTSRRMKCWWSSPTPRSSTVAARVRRSPLTSGRRTSSGRRWDSTGSPISPCGRSRQLLA